MGRKTMGEKTAGKLVIIGGAEDKKGECKILKRFLDLSGGQEAKIVIMTTATEKPKEVGQEYEKIFIRLGARKVEALPINSRSDAENPYFEEYLREASGIFFTGGDQLRITSTLGGTRISELLSELYHQGVIVAGTSAGASVMSDTMIIGGQGSETPKKSMLSMAPGLGFLKEVLIDQHFAQRGRIGRLLEAVAQNPYILGIGIDEDTAIVVNSDALFEVVGSQTVTVVDGRYITHTNISELEPQESLALLNVVLHVLPAGYSFDLQKREAIVY